VELAPICEKHNESKRQVGTEQKWKCQSCNREYQAAWWKDNKVTQQQRVSANTIRYRRENAQLIWDYKSTHPCIDCGETDPIVLDFDHLDSTEKSFGIPVGVNKAFSKARLMREIEKCVVRCANCHRRRTAVQLGWYSEQMANQMDTDTDAFHGTMERSGRHIHSGCDRINKDH